MQRLLIFLLKLLGPRWGIDPVVADNFEGASRLGTTEQVPLALLRVATRLWSKGWLNRAFFDTRSDWVLPYWAFRQLDPLDRSFVQRGLQPIWLNQTQRDWTIIGNPGSPFEALVDPRGLITPHFDGWSIDIWVKTGDQLFVPSRLQDSAIQQRLFEGLPIVQTRYEASGLRVIQEAFADLGEDAKDWAVASLTVENPRGEARSATAYLSIRPYNPEGVAVVHKVEWRQEHGDKAWSFWVDESLGGYIPRPDEVARGNEKTGDVALHIPSREPVTESLSDSGLATAAAGFNLQLPPHSARSITAVLSMSAPNEDNPKAAEWTAPERLKDLRGRASSKWRDLLKCGMSIRIPDDKLQESFDANKSYLLLLHDGDAITPGPLIYHDFWFRDAAYMLNALGQLGYHDQVKQVIQTYPRRMRKDGYYLAADGEWDSNGQALWSLEQYTRLSGDLEVIADQYWTMLNGAHWIDAMRQRTKTNGVESPIYGLLSASRSAEHLGPPDIYYWDDFWGLAGLRSAAYAAHLFAKAKDEEKLVAGLDAFRSDVDRSLSRMADQNRGLWMPASPDRGADSAMVANLAALYPLQLFGSHDPRISATIEELERVAWVDGAFFHHVGHSGFGTYLSLHIAGCLLHQRSAEAWRIIQWLLDHASPTYTWAEAIHPATRHGGMGDSPHGWTAADWISILRNAMLFEEGKHLVLTPAIPSDWTFETMSLSVQKAATWFGNVDFTIAFGDHAATLVIDGVWRDPPDYVEWNLPFQLLDAGGDREGVELIGNRVRMPSTVRKVVARWQDK